MIIVRSKQQDIDPFDLNYPEPKRSEVIHVDQCDNITEEIELTLEQLKQAHDLTTEEILEVIESRKNKGESDSV